MTKRRGAFLRGGTYAERLLPTVHPAAVLRQPDEAGTTRRFKALLRDLPAARKRATLGPDDASQGKDSPADTL